jgi:hypothetical protein
MRIYPGSPTRRCWPCRRRLSCPSTDTHPPVSCLSRLHSKTAEEPRRLHPTPPQGSKCDVFRPHAFEESATQLGPRRLAPMILPMSDHQQHSHVQPPNESSMGGLTTPKGWIRETGGRAPPSGPLCWRRGERTRRTRRCSPGWLAARNAVRGRAPRRLLLGHAGKRQWGLMATVFWCANAGTTPASTAPASAAEQGGKAGGGC